MEVEIVDYFGGNLSTYLRIFSLKVTYITKLNIYR